ncbi:MAG: transaldolase [Acidimicrobiales bacterium]|nr:transaldolase [Acidimicrobiales bacterium]MCB1015830.1 transaldolase [Acidimicrobiales bacterium]
MTTRLQRLYEEQDQSPWLDNLKRGWITSGELERWVADGVRGITSNPTIFQKAMAAGDAYDAQLAELTAAGASTVDSYWAAVTKDITDALDVLAPVHDASDGLDGYVSLELAPELARDTDASIEAARHLHTTIDRPNLYVKIPGTAEGLPAIEQMIAEGRSINVTLIFGLDRYGEVIEAYLSGLEACEGDLAPVSSVASFFVSRLDTEVDRRLETLGTEAALALRGKAAVAQAQCAYQLFLDRFSGPRWEALAARGARVQRPLWASTSTKNPDYPDTLYVDELVGPRSVNTMPDATLEAFEDHGSLERRVDADPDAARATLDALAEVGIDMADVTRVLEDEGVASFSKSFDELLGVLDHKAEQLRQR